MNDTNIDRVFEDLVHVMPVLHRRLLRRDLGGLTGNLTRLHLSVMRMLAEGSMPASDLARRSRMSRPQVTHVVDQLVKLDIVERHPDTEDRRVINLALSEHGRVVLRDIKNKVMENMRQKLSGLAPEDLEKLRVALQDLRDVFAKL